MPLVIIQVLVRSIKLHRYVIMFYYPNCSFKSARGHFSFGNGYTCTGISISRKEVWIQSQHPGFSGADCVAPLKISLQAQQPAGIQPGALDLTLYLLS